MFHVIVGANNSSSFVVLEHFYQQTCPRDFTSRELHRKAEGVFAISEFEILWSDYCYYHHCYYHVALYLCSVFQE